MNRRKPNGLAARRHGSAAPLDDEEDARLQYFDRSDDNRQEGCGCAGAGFPLLAEVCKTADDILAICVLRFVLAGYCHDRMQCFDAAIDAAASVHGEEFGLALMTRAVAVVRALKAERNGNFRYLPANCCRICEDEQALVEAMSAVRANDPLATASTITILSRSNHAPRIMQAVWAFSVTSHTVSADSSAPVHASQPQATFH